MGWWPPGYGYGWGRRRQRRGGGEEAVEEEANPPPNWPPFVPPPVPPQPWPPFFWPPIPEDLELEFLRIQKRWLEALRELVDEQLRLLDRRIRELEGRGERG
ncbi:MAG: hypothetical protein DSY37_02165 [Hyperthermus sp.]|nr:MAG: hypothetical protein DSY37_02165 [Hyperthermus sp.]